jgi:hypothetical protein
MLEQALAVLEPILEHGDDALVHDLDDIRAQVGELRERLTNLEDAQDELLVEDDGEIKAETDEQPPEDARLDGPERPPRPKPASALSGPERPPEPAKPMTLTGPAIPDEPAKPSTLSGAELPARPAAPSTLSGTPIADAPAQPTTLGDADDIAKAQATPWWRRMFD